MIKKSCDLKVCPICGTKAIYICERFGDGMGCGFLCKKQVAEFSLLFIGRKMKREIYGTKHLMRDKQ